ncbi:MAG: DUF1835 domain-containing protein [Paenibacillaceae bacterium]
MKTHIVFEASTRETLKQAFKINQIAEQIVAMEDDLMSGPLGNILLDNVQALRLKWWEQVLNEEDKTHDIPYLCDTFKNFSERVKTLTDNDSLLFWVGDSPTEHTGFMCLLANLPNSIPVSVVMVSPAYYKRYGKIRPRSAGEVLPDKMFPLMEDAKVLPPRVRGQYVTNWNRLLEDDGVLRISKNRQVETVTEEYFDQEIIERAKRICRERMYRKSDGFFPAARLVGNVIGHQKQRIMDELIDWRIRCIIQRDDSAIRVYSLPCVYI